MVDGRTRAARSSSASWRWTIVGKKMTTATVAGLLLIVVSIAFNVAFALLAARFDYPDILRQPTTEVLVKFQAGGVWIATGLSLRRSVAERDHALELQLQPMAVGEVDEAEDEIARCRRRTRALARGDGVSHPARPRPQRLTPIKRCAKDLPRRARKSPTTPKERVMKRLVAVLVPAMALAASGAASAAITQSSNNGHPNTNPAGNCPAGQNQGATPGALNKC
jgi:hypothetical protein